MVYTIVIVKANKGTEEMYKSGELDMVMNHFEQSIKKLPIYVSGSFERAERKEIELDNGRTSYRYAGNNYYNNGTVNQLFIMFLNGYSYGKMQ